MKSSSRATIGDYHEVASEEAINIVCKIKESYVLDEVRYDCAIMVWLNAEASKHETTPHHHVKIRANLRRLGRLKIEMKILNDNINEFSDILNEDYYDDFIESCKVLGKAEANSKYLRSSSTANEMSYIVKNVGNVYHVMLGSEKQEERAKVEAFFKKVQILWYSSIGNTIAETQANNRRNKVVKLPSQEDTTILRQYLENEMSVSYNSLRIEYSDESYLLLRNSIVSYLHVTNFMRAGEIEKLSFDDYNSLQISGEDCRIQVRGKRSTPIPIFF